jgi:hypothetical protein
VEFSGACCLAGEFNGFSPFLSLRERKGEKLRENVRESGRATLRP